MCPLTIYPASSGDVTGPASATSGHIAVFSGPTGKIIADGGAPGTGTVSSVSATVNGVAATVTNPTTTPAIVVKSGGLEVADATARLALTGYPVLTQVKQTDTGFVYTLINSAAPGSEASWLVTPKTYQGVLNQASTDAPVPTVGVNDLGIVAGDFTYDATGSYILTKTGAFPAGTFITIGGNGDPTVVCVASRSDSDTISISTFSNGEGADEKLTNTAFEIRTYPQ